MKIAASHLTVYITRTQFIILFHTRDSSFSSSSIIFHPTSFWNYFTSESDHDGIDHGDDYEEVDNYTNHDMVIFTFWPSWRWTFKLSKWTILTFNFDSTCDKKITLPHSRLRKPSKSVTLTMKEGTTSFYFHFILFHTICCLLFTLSLVL